MIGALSYALDVAEGQPPGHAIRSCLIGMRLVEAFERFCGYPHRLDLEVRGALEDHLAASPLTPV